MIDRLIEIKKEGDGKSTAGYVFCGIARIPDPMLVPTIKETAPTIVPLFHVFLGPTDTFGASSELPSDSVVITLLWVVAAKPRCAFALKLMQVQWLPYTISAYCVDLKQTIFFPSDWFLAPVKLKWISARHGPWSRKTQKECTFIRGRGRGRERGREREVVGQGEYALENLQGI